MKKIYNILNKIVAYLEKHGAYKAQKYLNEQSDYRKTFKELNKLSDKELLDIGLTRGDIHYVALGSYSPR
jgi:uncharacterized protein YjiS (DUF1127 family)